jgi:hypothetical protein
MMGGKRTAALSATAALLLARVAPAAAADLPNLQQPSSNDRAQAIDCMTTAILYEAGFEPRAGQEAVAEVILNRLRSPAFPKTICGVVFQGSERHTGCQFSFTCDGSLRKILPIEAVARAREVATLAIEGLLTPRTSGATHFHADYVSPYWAPTLVRVATIGRHIFYRQPGAGELSHLTRYDAAGEQMPASIGNSIRVASIATQRVPPETTHEPEKFMPWGLSSDSLVRPQSDVKR